MFNEEKMNAEIDPSEVIGESIDDKLVDIIMSSPVKELNNLTLDSSMNDLDITERVAGPNSMASEISALVEEASFNQDKLDNEEIPCDGVDGDISRTSSLDDTLTESTSGTPILNTTPRHPELHGKFADFEGNEQLEPISKLLNPIFNKETSMETQRQRNTNEYVDSAITGHRYNSSNELGYDQYTSNRNGMNQSMASEGRPENSNNMSYLGMEGDHNYYGDGNMEDNSMYEDGRNVTSNPLMSQGNSNSMNFMSPNQMMYSTPSFHGRGRGMGPHSVGPMARFGGLTSPGQFGMDVGNRKHRSENKSPKTRRKSNRGGKIARFRGVMKFDRYGNPVTYDMVSPGKNKSSLQMINPQMNPVHMSPMMNRQLFSGHMRNANMMHMHMPPENIMHTQMSNQYSPSGLLDQTHMSPGCNEYLEMFAEPHSAQTTPTTAVDIVKEDEPTNSSLDEDFEDIESKERKLTILTIRAIIEEMMEDVFEIGAYVHSQREQSLFKYPDTQSRINFPSQLETQVLYQRQGYIDNIQQPREYNMYHQQAFNSGYGIPHDYGSPVGYQNEYYQDAGYSPGFIHNQPQFNQYNQFQQHVQQNQLAQEEINPLQALQQNHSRMHHHHMQNNEQEFQNKILQHNEHVQMNRQFLKDESQQQEFNQFLDQEDISDMPTLKGDNSTSLSNFEFETNSWEKLNAGEVENENEVVSIIK